ncbi:MAG: hypothetical protein IJP07_02320 [Firmicutes bacterium]|nr:hypothetical protein [Bacillota bacterium]
MAKCHGKMPWQKAIAERLFGKAHAKKREKRSSRIQKSPVFFCVPGESRESVAILQDSFFARTCGILSSQEPVGFLLTQESVVSAKKGFFKDCHVAKLGFAGANPQLACLAMTGNLSYVIARMLLPPPFAQGRLFGLLLQSLNSFAFFLKEKKGLPAFLCKPQLSCKKVGQRTSVFGAIPKMRSDNCLYSPV